MARARRAKRLTLGLAAAGLAFGPLVGVAAAQDESPPDMAAIQERMAEMVNELLTLDLDGDGSPDIVDADGDGLPDYVPEGFPGERDITPENPLFLANITDELEALGVDTIVEITDDSVLTGDCSGFAMSFDEDGELKDMAIALGSRDGGGPNGQLIDLFGEGQVGSRAFTKSNPFQVYERVLYFGTLPRTGEGALEHNWEIKTSGISLDKGGDPNPQGKNRNSGEVDLSADVPAAARFTGIFGVDGMLTSQNNLSCEGEGWVEFKGPFPLLTVVGGAATAFIGAGVIGLLFNSRPAVTWRA